MLDKQNHIRLFIHVFIVLFLYFVCRVLFYVFNQNLFDTFDFSTLSGLFIAGVRFDFSAIIYTNSLFIIMYLWPFSSREKKGYRFILKFIYVFVNALALLSNCFDIAFFKYKLQRSSLISLTSINTKCNTAHCDMLTLFLKNEWYIFIIWMLLLVVLIQSYTFIDIVRTSDWRFKDFLRQSFILMVLSCLFYVGYRGGIQTQPIDIATADIYTKPKNTSIVLNTPFCIIKSYKK